MWSCIEPGLGSGVVGEIPRMEPFLLYSMAFKVMFRCDVRMWKVDAVGSGSDVGFGRVLLRLLRTTPR